MLVPKQGLNGQSQFQESLVPLSDTPSLDFPEDLDDSSTDLGEVGGAMKVGSESFEKETSGKEVGELEDIPSVVVFQPGLLFSEMCSPFEVFHDQIKDEGGRCTIMQVTRYIDVVEVQFAVTKPHVEVFKTLFEAVFKLEPEKGYIKKTPKNIKEPGDGPEK